MDSRYNFLGWAGDQQTQNKRIRTAMPQVGFEPTNTVFKRAKTFHALDRTVTMNGEYVCYN
jgi:hypothetical protein